MSDTPTTEGVGLFAQEGQRPPYNALFRQLRDLWVSQVPDERRTFGGLAMLFNDVSRKPIASQHVSQWATGSDGRLPPWHVLMLLCAWTGSRIVATPYSWRIEPDPGRVLPDNDDG